MKGEEPFGVGDNPPPMHALRLYRHSAVVMLSHAVGVAEVADAKGCLNALVLLAHVDASHVDRVNRDVSTQGRR